MSTAPAGWYPQDDGRQRYWDGNAWTAHFAPGRASGPAPAAGPPALEAPTTAGTSTVGVGEGTRTVRVGQATYQLSRRAQMALALGTAVLLGIIIGALGKTSPASSAASAARPAGVTSTATVTVAGTVPPLPGPTVTVAVTATVPGPVSTVTYTPTPVAAFDQGVLVVGTEIQPGVYRAPNPDGLCYWARLKGTTGEFGDLIANGNPDGPVTVTIKTSDKAFSSARCGGWSKVG